MKLGKTLAIFMRNMRFQSTGSGKNPIFRPVEVKPIGKSPNNNGWFFFPLLYTLQASISNYDQLWPSPIKMKGSIILCNHQPTGVFETSWILTILLQQVHQKLIYSTSFMQHSHTQQGPRSINNLRLTLLITQNIIWLVVYLPLWKIWVRQWDGWHPIYDMENNPFMFESTNQILIIIN